jgi:hypothetical protein
VVSRLENYTFTHFQPWPVTGPFPVTVTQTVIAQGTLEQRLTTLYYAATDYTYSSSHTEIQSWKSTGGQTWVVRRPQETDLPAGKTAACAGWTSSCYRDGNGGREAETEPEPDPACEARGLRTACNEGQCELRREGKEWWCYQMWESDWSNSSLRMGRTCWGGDREFRQLNVPCVRGDVEVGRVPCQGINTTWGAWNWDGPGALDPFPSERYYSTTQTSTLSRNN